MWLTQIKLRDAPGGPARQPERPAGNHPDTGEGQQRNSWNRITQGTTERAGNGQRGRDTKDGEFVARLILANVSKLSQPARRR